MLDGLVGIQLSLRNFDVEVWCNGMVFGSGHEHNLSIPLARYNIYVSAHGNQSAHIVSGTSHSSTIVALLRFYTSCHIHPTSLVKSPKWILLYNNNVWYHSCVT